MKIKVEMLFACKSIETDEHLYSVTCDDETVSNHINHCILKFGKKIQFSIRPI